MKTTITITLNELLGAIHDKHMVLSMIVIPIVLFSLIFSITENITKSRNEKSHEIYENAK